MALTGQRKTSLSCASGSMRALKTTRNACDAARLVAGEHQDEDQAAASWCSQTESHPLKRRRTTDIQLLTWPPCSPDLSPLDFHLWQAWETALIVRTLPDLDPEATEQACTAGFIHRWVHSQMLGVRARQRLPFRAPPVMDQLTCTRFFFF